MTVPVTARSDQPMKLSHDRRWNLGYEALRAYYLEHGNVNVPREYLTPEGLQLGKWTKTQRSSKKTVRSHWRRHRLDELGFEWNQNEAAWNRGVEAFKVYLDTYDNPMVPAKYVSPDGFKLGSWVTVARATYRYVSDKPQRALDLETLGFSWTGTTDKWSGGLEEFKKYIAEFNSVMVPSTYISPSGFELGLWVTRQRERFRSSKFKSPELDALGFSWRGRPRQSWMDGMTELRRYAKKHGHCKVPESHVTPSGFDLGKWVKQRRQQLKVGRLSPERIKALDKLGFLWTIHKTDATTKSEATE